MKRFMEKWTRKVKFETVSSILVSVIPLAAIVFIVLLVCVPRVLNIDGRIYISVGAVYGSLLVIVSLLYWRYSNPDQREEEIINEAPSGCLEQLLESSSFGVSLGGIVNMGLYFIFFVLLFHSSMSTIMAVSILLSLCITILFGIVGLNFSGAFLLAKYKIPLNKIKKRALELSKQGLSGKAILIENILSGCMWSMFLFPILCLIIVPFVKPHLLLNQKIAGRYLFYTALMIFLFYIQPKREEYHD